MRTRSRKVYDTSEAKKEEQVGDTSRKMSRKRAPERQQKKPNKKSRTGEGEVERKTEGQEDVREGLSVKINRAPVLTLWVAVVAEREGYKFEEGLSFGRAIAGILAHSKGKSLGLYEEKEEEAEAKKKKKKKAAEKFDVFGMNLAGKRTPDGLILATQQEKAISPSSTLAYLRKNFGSMYDKVKGVLEVLANSYGPEELGKLAYSLYEKFRPTVPYGIKGWGAKGKLNLDYVKSLSKH